MSNPKYEIMDKVAMQLLHENTHCFIGYENGLLSLFVCGSSDVKLQLPSHSCKIIYDKELSSGEIKDVVHYYDDDEGIDFDIPLIRI